MNETLRTSSPSPVPSTSPAHPLALPHPLQVGGPPAGADERGGEVTVAAGLYVQRFPLAGLTVGQVRTRLRSRLAIEDRAVAVIDGREAGADTVLQTGQTVTFVRRAGERGCVDPCRRGPATPPQSPLQP